MALQKRSTVGAIVEETTEAVPVAPSSATDDYIALQDDFSMEPSFEVLENAELTGSIGQSKSILGIEEPSASVSHYLKHSGVEGEEPNYGLLVESLMGGKTVNATEYDTIVGSTAGSASAAATIVVDAGEGANFERGQLLLIKDGTNGYRIRPIESVSGDTLTLGFNLPSAPGTGVDLGKCVLYKPANENHPSFSTWYYQANSGFIEMMAGSRATSMAITAEAGQLINSAFEIEGVAYYFDPIEVAAADIYVDFTDDAGTFAAQVDAKFYKDPHELASALQTAMNSLTTETHAVSYSDSSGKFTISTSTSAVLSLLWNTGTNAANTLGDKMGFSVAADDTGATSYESDSEQSWVAPQSPSYDAASPLAAKSHEVMVGDFDDYACYNPSSVSINVGGTKSDLLDICADSGKSGSLITAREVSVDVVARINKHDADKFKRFRNNENTSFSYHFGEKSGGNWVAGKSGGFYMPTATITSHTVQDTDGVLEIAMTLTGYVNSGLGEAYLGFV